MKQSKKNRAEAKAEAKAETRQAEGKRSKTKKIDPATKRLAMMLVAVCVLMTAIVYIPALNGDFINMDDDDYVSANQTIQSLGNMKKLISAPVQGNYHPLTMISLAVNYSISGLNTGSYHMLSLLLHLCNTILVFMFIRKLSNDNLVMSFCAALLFGVHPMHVESVAWISERKDVLYTFFFLLALINYLRYVDTQKKSAYVFSLILFILSLASKPAAIVFPLAALSVDYFRARTWNMSVMIEKIPLFVCSGILALMTLNAQTAGGATDVTGSFELSQRFFFGFYSFMMYVYKFFVPLNLAPFYPLPEFNKPLSAAYYISPLFFVGVAALCYMTRKKAPIIAWGFLFFFVNLILILQFKVIGSAIIAERYSYVPYIGLFAVLGWLIDHYLPNKRSIALGVVALLGLACSARSYQQADAWKNSASLWESAIANVPSARAYNNRASTLREEGKAELALQYYSKGLALNPVDYWALVNRGNIYFDQSKDSLAFADYNLALSIKPDFASGLANRGALNVRRARPELALPDLNRALTINPELRAAYSYRAVAEYNTRQFDAAIRDYSKYLSYYPNDLENRLYMARSHQFLGQHNEAVAALSQCIRLSPKAVYFVERARSYAALQKIPEAQADAKQAMSLGAGFDPAFLKSLGL